MTDTATRLSRESQGSSMIAGGVETMLRLQHMSITDGVARGSMLVGPWARDADGRDRLGALGVLIDNVLGWALLAARPDGWWSVSAEISLDVLAPLPADGSLLVAHAETIARDAAGVYAVCRVVDDSSGALIAHATQRGRWIPVDDDFLAKRQSRSAWPTRPDDGPDFLDTFGASIDSSGAVVLDAHDATLNLRGVVHGGITLGFCDVAAAQVAGADLATTSLRVTYPRAIPAGSVIRFDPVLRSRGRTFAVIDVGASVDDRVCAIAQVTAHRPHDV